ncbi:MAG: MBL fold metallo-hydrolase [Candidatus Aminicenantes bacterium]|nr:MBL fold metallo-hydrolase [Candidatus Aminicenantes bacterium]
MSEKKRFVSVLFLIVLVVLAASPKGVMSELFKESDGGPKISILYDNYVYTDGTKADWGFSCLITGMDKTILFDAGTRSDILWHNIKTLGVEMESIDLIVISHNHGDHTGGLFSVLDTVKQVPVYIPSSFPEGFFEKVKEKGSRAVRVSEPVEICDGIFSTGEMGISIKEQSLVMQTEQGGVLITGCAHPGIVKIVEKAAQIVEDKVYFALGGFHLMQKSDDQVDQIINRFHELGVLMCGATHCTGDRAIRLFEQAFGDHYVTMGVGRVVKIQ